MKSKVSTFNTFPEFSKLRLEDKDSYEAYIKDYPPIYDISFPGLMSWWNPLGNMAISELNGNLVIPYWLPGDEENAGLSLIGTHKIDESICAIFDHLREKGEPVRLINVPEFVLSYIRYHDMYNLVEQEGLKDYLMPFSHFYPLKNMAPHWRSRVERFINNTHADDVTCRCLDLKNPTDKSLILTKAKIWRPKNKINDFGQIEGDAIEHIISESEALNIDNLCLFVNNELWGFCLYEVSANRKYVIMKHIKATNKNTCGFELLAYFFSKRLTDQGFTYANLGADYDIQALRMFMLTIGADKFFRKYKIEPRQ